VLGICGSFQILVESGLFRRAIRTGAEDSPSGLRVGTLSVHRRPRRRPPDLPIAHGEAATSPTNAPRRRWAEDRVSRYTDNPNGSLRDIAGILNRERNVMGLMPHPERAADPLMGSTDGLVLFRSMVSTMIVK
jgi:phosphoribosylformylglycinamidine synthase